ncbi:MAG: MAPEG family protein [Pseudomonadales bacterium]
MPITPIYAGALALLFVALSVRTLRLRRRLGIAIGDGGDDLMLRAMRAHANFAEYTPLALLLVLMLELQGGSPWQVHALGAMLLAGRTLHAFGVSRTPERYVYRVSGMALTFTVIIGAALGAAGLSLSGL